MTSTRSLTAAAAALFVTGLVSLGAFAQAPGAPPGTGTNPPVRQKTPDPFLGRISRIDIARQSLTLENAVDGALGAAATGTTRDTGGKGTKAATTGRTMVFDIANKVEVTLDGKAATLKDLKVGHYARVHTGKRLDGTPGLGRDAGDERGDLTRRDRGTDTRVGRTTSAWRIQAYSKAPKLPEKTDKARDRDR
jgi:hypothetical protein